MHFAIYAPGSSSSNAHTEDALGGQDCESKAELAGGNCDLCIKQEASSLHFYFPKKIPKAVISYDSW